MTSRLYVAKVGGGEIELTGFTDGLKGTPMLDQNDHLVELGQRFANGEASQGQFKLIDPVGELPRTDFEYNLPAHKLVTWTEDASGDEIWLSRGRVSTYDGGRGFPVGGDQVEYDAIVDDGNVELRGQAFTEGWARPEEMGWARLVALQAYTLDGATSTNPTARATCEVTFSDSHLAPNADTATMPAKTYPPGTQPQDVVTECADTEGKVYGVVIHHDGGSHLCLLYIVEGDHTTYASPIKISDQIADWDPTDLTAPVFEPHWEMGKATVYDGQELVSGLVSTWGDGQYVFSEHTDNITDYDRWIEHFGDSESETAPQAINVNESERTYRQLTHVTHRVSIIVLPEQCHLVTAGMSLQIKATAAIAGQYLGTYQTRRVAEHSFRPRSDGRYWADLNLDRSLRRRAYRRGAGAKSLITTPYVCIPSVDPDGGCEDTFDRTVGGDWGTSGIMCLDWNASSNGSHSVDGAAGVQTVTDVAEPAADWFDFDAWNGDPVEFLSKLRIDANSRTRTFSIFQASGTAAYGPIGISLATVFRWDIGLGVSGNVTIEAFATPGGASEVSDAETVALGADGTDWLWVRCRLTSTQISMKVWMDGSSEPGAYQAVATAPGGIDLLEWLLDGSSNPGTPCNVFGYFSLSHATDLAANEIDSIAFSSGMDCLGNGCEIPCPPPASGQPVNKWDIGMGDDVTTLFTLPLAGGYMDGSLLVWVDGLLQNVTETDPAAGTFTLDFAPTSEELITASWSAI